MLHQSHSLDLLESLIYLTLYNSRNNLPNICHGGYRQRLDNVENERPLTQQNKEQLAREALVMVSTRR